MEDYALRYTPRQFRKWSELRVANTASGAASFLAMETIGGTIAMKYGFANAVAAILLVGVVIFVTGLPISYYAARYGLDMDLLTRGAGFGYLGSTVTSLIYASFTFIFFALEASIMAMALQMWLKIGMLWCYLLSSIVIIPLAIRGITLISRLQAWTQPVWLLLLVLPYLAIAWHSPGEFRDFSRFSGQVSRTAGFDLAMFGAAAVIPFSLIVQIGEQVDFLRFLPERTPENRLRWWSAVLLAGPGWIGPGVLKMLGGAFLTFLAIRHGTPPAHAVEPTQMYLTGYAGVFRSPTLILAATVLFVIVSQTKINVTNAYAGSLAWSNFFARLTHNHPGRVVWLIFNVVIALVLMAMDVFHAIDRVLGFYSNIAIAWVGALVGDLLVNKPLGLSPAGIEFKRGHLYDVNPVGVGAMGLAAAASIMAWSGALGERWRYAAPLLALLVAIVMSPVIAWVTRGRYYVARPHDETPTPGRRVRCSVCDNEFESEDILRCPAYDAPICSLCCTLESRCDDRCKKDSRIADQMRKLLFAVLPRNVAQRIDVRTLQYLGVFLALASLVAAVVAIVYVQESQTAPPGTAVAFLQAALFKVFGILTLIVGVSSWWIVLAGQSRRVALDEANRQNRLLTMEIDAHQRTDMALQKAKESAEAANQAKTRYVAGITHELRSPLNSILGYSQILLKSRAASQADQEGIQTIHRSAEHMLALVDGLLDLARIEAGRLRLDLAPLLLSEFLDELVAMIRPQIESKGLQFTYSHSGAMPAWVQADGKYLRQILLNLLSNAARFTDGGRVSLHVNCLQEVLCFDVADTGIGIAPQDVQRIFSPFERGANGRHRRNGGTGLGLTISALLASLMGGELALVRSSSAGSLFRLRLHLREVTDPGVRTPVPPFTGGYLGPRKSLLVVDDQPEQRQMLAGMLAQMGFEVREAASGRECIDVLSAAPLPDAVLLDITMDDMDGWETARRVRAAGNDTPIVIVSANIFENQPARLRAAGCQAFVGKPVIESELMQTLQRALQLEFLSSAPPRIADQEELAPAKSPIRLPAGFHERALQELRTGHVSGLLTVLKELKAAHPEFTDACADMSRLSSRLELGRIERILGEGSHD